MAERETVAVLVIDETGAVRSVNALRDSLPQLERQTRTTADVFTERFFSMRHAAIAFFGAFTLGGVIMQLRQFATSVLESAGAFGEFKKKADELDFRLKEFLVHALDINSAIQDMTVWMDRLIFLGNQMASAADSPLIKGVGVVNKFLFGLTGAGMTLKILEKAGEMIDKARAGQPVGAGPMQGPPVPSGFFPGAEEPPGLRNTVYAPDLLKKGVDVYQEWLDAIKAQEEALGQLEKGLNLGAISPGQRLREIDGVMQLVDAAQKLPDALSAAEQATTPLKNAVSELGVATEIAGTAFQFLAASMAQAVLEGGNGGKLFHDMLVGLSRAMFAKAAEYFAYAIAASTGIGAATLGGTPAQFAHAALKFLGVGLAAGAAARAVGDGGGGGAGGVAVGFTPSPTTGSGRPSITIVVEGNVVGNEEFIRDHIIPGVQKAFTDNANGGGFN